MNGGLYLRFSQTCAFTRVHQARVGVQGLGHLVANDVHEALKHSLVIITMAKYL